MLLAPENKSKHQHQARSTMPVLKDMFYASEIVLPVDFNDTRSCLVLADVSHRNNDRETGEFRSHEGRLRHVPAAPSSSPFQLPISAAHALRPHPAQGQGALHLQVRASAPPQQQERSPCVSRHRATSQQRHQAQGNFTWSSALSGYGWAGKTRSSGIRTEHADD